MNKKDIATPSFLLYRIYMRKDTYIIVRVSHEDKEAYQAAADARGKGLSEFIRNYLDGAVKRMEKTGGVYQ